ncbi:MAG TPA: type II toxin-antitoxin system HicB family antitoxin [Gaiellaceae bacterium]
MIDSNETISNLVRMKTYTAIFERDESGAWLARIPSIRGCHTHGRTLEQTRSRLREALCLWIDRPEEAVFEEEIRLPADLKAAVRRSRRTRERSERERESAQEQTRAAAEALVRAGVSLRDAGELLGLSHQRVQQLVGTR